MKVWLLAWGQRRDKDSKPEMLEQCGIYSRQQPPLNGSNSFFLVSLLVEMHYIANCTRTGECTFGVVLLFMVEGRPLCLKQGILYCYRIQQ